MATSPFRTEWSCNTTLCTLPRVVSGCPQIPLSFFVEFDSWPRRRLTDRDAYGYSRSHDLYFNTLNPKQFWGSFSLVTFLLQFQVLHLYGNKERKNNYNNFFDHLFYKGWQTTESIYTTITLPQVLPILEKQWRLHMLYTVYWAVHISTTSTNNLSCPLLLSAVVNSLQFSRSFLEFFSQDCWYQSSQS